MEYSGWNISDNGQVTFKLQTLHETRTIETEIHVTNSINNYDMLKNYQSLQSNDIVAMESESPAVVKAIAQMKQILEAKYEQVDIKEGVAWCKHLSNTEQQQLFAVLSRFKSLFDGTLGHWNNEHYDITLQPNVKPYHARPYPISKIHEATLKIELERLCKIGVLRKINRSKWGSPRFIIPKKDGTVWFISDFRELNKRIKWKSFPLPKIQDFRLKLEGFQSETSLDLNMGYYHIELNPHAKQLCKILLPWGKYEYQCLPMGLCNSPDIFQEKMSCLKANLEYVRAYIDDLLIITKGNYLEHLQKLATVLTRLQ
jgi:hypothetical protein